jgi:hypothetical protein
MVPLDRRLGGPQRRSGRGGEEKNSQPTPGIEPYNPDRPACIPALYRLSHRGSYYFEAQGYQRFGGLLESFTEKLEFYRNSTRRHNPEDLDMNLQQKLIFIKEISRSQHRTLFRLTWDSFNIFPLRKSYLTKEGFKT